MRALVAALSSRGVPARSSSSRGSGAEDAIRFRGVLSRLTTRRSVVHVFGKDTLSFLNGLVAQQVGPAKTWDAEGAVSVYAPLLTAQGRVLADALLYYRPQARSVFLELDTPLVPTVLAHLRKYKLRSAVHLEPEAAGAYDVYALLASDLDTLRQLIVRIANTTDTSHMAVYPDPRWPLALRLIVPAGGDGPPLPELLHRPHAPSSTSSIQQGLLYYDPDASLYTSLRHLNGISEGALDLGGDSAIPLQVNMDLMHGIDFGKGCYLGQELVARTYHQGLVRKRLLPLISLPHHVALDAHHPLHQQPLVASYEHLIPPGYAAAVAEGWVNPEALLPVSTVGATLLSASPPSHTPLPPSRQPSSIVSVSDALNTGLAMMRLEQVLGPDAAPLAVDAPAAPQLTSTVFRVDAEPACYTKVLLPLSWQPKPASLTQEAASPLQTVRWDLEANVKRPY